MPIDSSDKVGPNQYFFTVVAFLVTEILPIKSFPAKMSATNHFRHHATCHSKALKEYCSNIYSFIM